MNAEASNLIEQQQQDAAAAKASKAATDAANGTKQASETTSLAFGYDPAAAETVFGKAGEDGRPANIPAKYWDADGRKVKADVVFNQLRWAESKIGKPLEIIGAPAEGYKLNVPAPKEGEEPWIVPEDDPAIKGFLAVAKKHDVSQKFVDEVLAEVVKQADEVRPVNLKAEIDKLGKDAGARLTNMQHFLGAHLTKEQVATVNGLLTSAEAFTALEALVRASGAPAFVPRDPDNRPADTGRMTVEQWNALNFEMVEKGGQQVRRRSVDPAFNARVEKLRDEVFGTERRDPSGRPVTETGQRV